MNRSRLVWAWAKTNERLLWWVYLVICTTIMFVRDPQCASSVPLWTWVLPIAVFAICFAYLVWLKRRYR